MEPQPSRRWGCWTWIWVLVAFVALGLLTLVLWVRSDSDMVAVEARLRELGLPMTWKELGLPAPTASQRATMDRLRQLAAVAKEYPESYRWRNDPLLPSSPGLRAWAQGHGSGVDPDLDAVLDAADGGMWLTSETEAWDADLACGTWKTAEVDDPRWKIAEVLFARGIGLDVAEAPALLPRIAHLVHMQSMSRNLGLMTSLRIAERWSHLVVRWRSAEPAATASQAMALADDLDRALVQMTAARLLMLLHFARSDVPQTARAMGKYLPEIMEYPFTAPVVWRAGRAPTIWRNIEIVRKTRMLGPVRTLAEIDHRATPEPSRGLCWDLAQAPVLLYSLTFDEGGYWGKGRVTFLHAMHRRHLQVTTWLRLLAADLDGQPWPSDPCDPAGKPLHPILRDGRVIGAYSFGPDGLDGGGDRRTDWCWPLRERLGKIRAGDPPEDPPP